MTYVQPQIIGTFAARSTIQGPKVGPNHEINQDLTPAAAYEADE